MINNNPKTVSLKSISIVTSAVVLYWVLFLVLHEIFSIPPFPLTILPMVASSWFFGTKRGLFSGTLIMLSSLFFIIVFHLHQNSVLTETLVIAISFVLGAASGWVRKLYDTEKMHSKMLAEEHSKLLNEMEERKNAESRASWDEYFLKTMSNSSPLGILAVNTGTNEILYCNHKLFEIWKAEEYEEKLNRKEIKLLDLMQHCVSLIKEAKPHYTIFTSLLNDNVLNEFTVDVSLKDGRIIRRFTSCIRGKDGEYLGRLFMYEDVTKRKMSEVLLKKRFDFEYLVYSISNQFINVSAENIGNVFISSLKMVCEFLEMERAYFFNSNLETGEIVNQYKWCSQVVSNELPKIFRIDSIIWPLFKERLLKHDAILMPDAEALPPEKSRQKEFLQSCNVRSALVVPVVFNNTLIGFLGFDSILPKRFPEDTSEMLKIIGDIFANAILQKQKNEALLASEERFRLLIQHSTDTIGILDVNGYVTYVSPSAKSLTGKRPEEWLGKQLYPYLHPDDAGKVKGAIRNFVENPDLPPVKLSLRLPSEDGSTVFMETILNGQLNNPAIKGIVCNSRDMSQHFALQEALRNSRNFLNAIINCASDPMFVKDSSHKYVIVNDAFCRLAGRKRHEMIGKTAQDLFIKEEAADFFNKNEQVLNEEKIMDFENIFTDANNNKHIMASHMSFYKEESGEKFLIANLRDETRRKEMEREINNALVREKELNEMKSKFISMVSHEYRTPLTTILSSAELLELFGVDMTSDEKQEHLRGIKNTVQYMTSMLNEVLLINRVESKRMDYNPSSFELVMFCKELMQRLGIIKEFEIKMNTEFTSRTVFMDEKLLGHILTNLLSNAVKYSPEGATVWLNIKQNGRHINFEIIDKGLGIPEDVQNRLFEPFFRADNVHHISGSGLGLSIVKYCTDLHKGSVSFESKQGEGTKFLVSLPDESISQ